MTRNLRSGAPIEKNPRGNPRHDHSPGDRRHSHPASAPGMDEQRGKDKQHHKR